MSSQSLSDWLKFPHHLEHLLADCPRHEVRQRYAALLHELDRYLTTIEPGGGPPAPGPHEDSKVNAAVRSVQDMTQDLGKDPPPNFSCCYAHATSHACEESFLIANAMTCSNELWEPWVAVRYGTLALLGQTGRLAIHGRWHMLLSRAARAERRRARYQEVSVPKNMADVRR